MHQFPQYPSEKCAQKQVDDPLMDSTGMPRVKFEIRISISLVVRKLIITQCPMSLVMLIFISRLPLTISHIIILHWAQLAPRTQYQGACGR